jgi:hypothetical protein
LECGGCNTALDRTLTLGHGQTEGGPDNRQRGADQWLYFVSGWGKAIVNGVTGFSGAHAQMRT